MRNRLKCGIQTTVNPDWSVIDAIYSSLDYGQTVELRYDSMGSTFIKPRKG